MAHLLLQRYSELPDVKKTAAVQHLIFGLDDVIIDTENAGFEAFQFALRTEGQKNIIQTEHHELFSKEETDDKRFRSFLGIKQPKEASEKENELIKRLCKQKEDKKHEIIHQQFLAGKIQIIPGATELIRNLHAKGIKLAMTSENIYAADILNELGILNQFEVCEQRRKIEVSGQYHYVTIDTKSRFTLPEGQKILPKDSFTPCDVQFDGEPWPWKFFDTARRMGADPFNCGVVSSNPHINRENFELGFGASIFADTTQSFNKEKSRSGTVCIGESKSAVITQLSSQLQASNVLSESPTLPLKSDFYGSIHSSAATSATETTSEAEVPCVRLDRFTTNGTRETADIKYFLWDVEGCIIDSVPAQIKSFRDAILQIRHQYLAKIQELTMSQSSVSPDQALALEEKIKKLHAIANKLAYLTDEAYHELISGRSRDAGFRNFLGITRKEDASPEENELIKKLCVKKDEIFQQMLIHNEIKAFPAVVQMIKDLHTKGIKMAFASGSSNAAMMLHNAGILNLFEVGVQKGRGKHEGLYVTVPKPAEAKLEEGETEFSDAIFKKCDVEFHGKPMPWIFYKAAHKMGANPFECVVVEDSSQLTHQYYEAGFGAAIGVDTGGAFKKEAVRAGTVFYKEEKDTPKRVAKRFAQHIQLRVTKTLSKTRDVYRSVHSVHKHHPAGREKVYYDPKLFGDTSNKYTLSDSTNTKGQRSFGVPHNGNN